MTYAIEDDDPHRISAIDTTTGHEIAGAWISPNCGGAEVWRLYLTVHTDTCTHRWHPIVGSREGAREWIEAFATLYSLTQELKHQLGQEESA